MKVSKSFVQAIGILVMLAEQPRKCPLKSNIISDRLGASHTYLLKIANKLKRAGLINAISSKNGGYYLQKNPNKITYLDIYQAVENELTIDFNNSHVGELFENQELVKKGKKQLTATLSQAETAFNNELKKHHLTELVPKDESGKLMVIDWSKRV
ncbi:Rrf2 family transcriptional regulator [uncultured Limosilactobacillus sp.]|uniref:Rrf2 family transcriptional regulator n=1 Tax=uncultured Limosilactobacillus sp. TaxID=2837629 RepID=UPI0025DD5AAF|nr:Rrf2 family transcriptional regulator [uncultured Limosilactobacillus sp.]